MGYRDLRGQIHKIRIGAVAGGAVRLFTCPSSIASQQRALLFGVRG